MNQTQSLEQLGLTENEIEIYRFLLRNGSSSGTEVFLGLDMDKSSAYRALRKLQDVGLVTVTGETRNQLFIAEDSKKLLKLFRAQKKRLVKAKVGILEFINDIDEFAKNNYKNQNISVYQGVEGYKSWMEDRLRIKDRLIRELGLRSFIRVYVPKTKEYDSYLEDYIGRRVKAGIKLRYINDKTENVDKFDVTSKEMLKEVKQYQGDLGFTTLISTYDDKTSFHTLQDNQLLRLIIKDRFIAKMINKLYDVLWEQCEWIK